MKTALYARVPAIRDGKLTHQWQRVKTEKNGKPFAPVAPDNAGSYYLQFRDENGKRKVEAVGKVFSEAVTALRNRQIAGEFTKHGQPVPSELTESTQRTTIADKIAEFVTFENSLNIAPTTIKKYEKAAREFADVCLHLGVRYLDELPSNDRVYSAYVAWVRTTTDIVKKNGTQRDGTVFSRLSCLSVFYQHIKVAFPVAKKQWPRSAKQKPVIFTREEVAQMLSQATDDEHDLILLFLNTGFRVAEVAHLYYSDIDFNAGTINVSNKVELNFTTKNGEVRVEPLTMTAEFVERMKARRERYGVTNDATLIFPSTKGKPKHNGEVLGMLRRAAKRVGLEKVAFPIGKGCHKFRSTFATWYAARVGSVNARYALGHLDDRSINRYVTQTNVTRDTMSSIFSVSK